MVLYRRWMSLFLPDLIRSLKIDSVRLVFPDLICIEKGTKWSFFSLILFEIQKRRNEPCFSGSRNCFSESNLNFKRILSEARFSGSHLNSVRLFLRNSSEWKRDYIVFPDLESFSANLNFIKILSEARFSWSQLKKGFIKARFFQVQRA